MKILKLIKSFPVCAMALSATVPLVTLVSCGGNIVIIDPEQKNHETNVNGEALFHLSLVNESVAADKITAIVVDQECSKGVEVEAEGVAKPTEKDLYVMIKLVFSAGHQPSTEDKVKFNLKFTCERGGATIWESVVSGLTIKYDDAEKTTDSDWDGLTDDIDPEPHNNFYHGVMDCYCKQPLGFSVNYHELITAEPTEYNVELAKLGSVLSTDAYSPNNLLINEQIFTSNNRLSRLMGCQDWEEINLKNETWDTDSNDTAYCTVSHHDVSFEDKLYKIVFISFEGTVSNPEWISDFDVGIDDQDYYEKTGSHPDWKVNEGKNALHTKGVCVAKNRIVGHLEGQDGYFTRHNINLDTDNVILFINGHSRGGAMANLLSAYYIDKQGTEGYHGLNKIYGYCFATPYTTYDPQAKDEKYKPIHCVVNADDVVGKMPLAKWGTLKYGQEHICYISQQHKEEWEQNWSDLDDGNKHTYYHFDHFLDDQDLLPVEKRQDLYNIDYADIIPGQSFILNILPFETEEATLTEISSMEISLEKLHMDKYVTLAPIEDTVIGGWNISCINCGGALISLVSCFFGQEEINPDDVIAVLPVLENYMPFARRLIVNLAIAILESESANFLADMGNCCHQCPTYYFAAQNVDEHN